MKMKKKIWHGLFVLLCLFILMLPAKASSIPAERQKPLLVDDAGLLTTEESGRWFPYSSGKRNCFSAPPKWLLVTAITGSPKPAATVIAARARDSPQVEQAP